MLRYIEAVVMGFPPVFPKLRRKKKTSSVSPLLVVDDGGGTTTDSNEIEVAIDKNPTLKYRNFSGGTETNQPVAAEEDEDETAGSYSDDEEQQTEEEVEEDLRVRFKEVSIRVHDTTTYSVASRDTRAVEESKEQERNQIIQPRFLFSWDGKKTLDWEYCDETHPEPLPIDEFETKHRRKGGAGLHRSRTRTQLPKDFAERYRQQIVQHGHGGCYEAHYQHSSYTDCGNSSTLSISGCLLAMICNNFKGGDVTSTNTPAVKQSP